MNKFFKYLPCLAFVLVGCGGSTPGGGSDRGDGSIPVGRAQGNIIGPISVAVLASDGSSIKVETHNGEVHLPGLPPGETRFTCTSASRETTQTYTVNLPLVQENLFEFNIYRRGQDMTVSRVSFANGSAIEARVGDSVKLFFRAEGTGIQGLSASYWVEGGVGTINRGGVFKATAPGSGLLKGDLFGVQATLEVTVTP